MTDWSKFDNIKIDEVAEVEYDEVPFGRYAVNIASMELKESKKGNPMLAVRFKITSSEQHGRYIFMNQVLLMGNDADKYRIHSCNTFLRSLQIFSDSDITFRTMSDYAKLIEDVANELTENDEYELEYGQNAKGFNTYIIKSKL